MVKPTEIMGNQLKLINKSLPYTTTLKALTGQFIVRPDSNQTNNEGNLVEFLCFHVENSIQLIATAMKPIQNMNHKRK